MAHTRAVIQKLLFFISLWIGFCVAVYASPIANQASHVSQADENEQLTDSPELPDPSHYLTNDEVAKNPDHYAQVMRMRIARQEKMLNALSESTYKDQYKQQLRDDYAAFAEYLRFTLHKPDEAIAVYQNMAKLDADATPIFDLPSLAIADIQRFDKHDSKQAIAIYQKELARKSTDLSDADKEHAAMVHRWIKFELDYLEHGKSFSGSLDRNDMACMFGLV